MMQNDAMCTQAHPKMFELPVVQGPFSVSPNSLRTFKHIDISKHIISFLKWSRSIRFTMRKTKMFLSTSAALTLVHIGAPQRIVEIRAESVYDFRNVCVCVWKVEVLNKLYSSVALSSTMR